MQPGQSGNPQQQQTQMEKEQNQHLLQSHQQHAQQSSKQGQTQQQSQQPQFQQQSQGSQQQQNQQPMNPGISEREIEEILSSSGVINGNVTNGVQLGNAIADIIVKNNERLIQAIQSGNYNQPPLEDVYSGQHQTAQPTQMGDNQEAPFAGMTDQDIQANAQSQGQSQNQSQSNQTGTSGATNSTGQHQ